MEKEDYMAGRITVTPEELRRTSNSFNQKAEEINSILSYLRRSVDALTQQWEGSAKDSYFQTYYELDQKMRKFPVVVNGMASRLDLAANKIEETDQKLANALRG